MRRILPKARLQCGHCAEFCTVQSATSSTAVMHVHLERWILCRCSLLSATITSAERRLKLCRKARLQAHYVRFRKAKAVQRFATWLGTSCGKSSSGGSNTTADRHMTLAPLRFAPRAFEWSMAWLGLAWHDDAATAEAVADSSSVLRPTVRAYIARRGRGRGIGTTDRCRP